MAPNLAVKSESWLDLTGNSASYLRQAYHRQQEQAGATRNQKPLVKQKSFPARKSSASLVDTDYRCLNSQSVIPNDTNVQDNSNNNNNNTSSSSGKNEHLLIRLRQRSYRLNRSNSTTCSSSNLSNSIELNPASISNNQMISDVDQKEVPTIQQQQPAGRQELSFKLKSFRERFERRFNSRANSKQRDSGGLELGGGKFASRLSSPFARSWSSLSEQFNSKLSHLGHSWKNFLYNYQQQQLQGKLSKQERRQSLGPFSQVDANHLSQLQRPANIDELSRLLLGDESDDPHELQRIKHRLTADWIRRHSNLAVAGDSVDFGDRLELRMKTKDTSEDATHQAKIRPRSFQYSSSKDTKESPFWRPPNRRHTSLIRDNLENSNSNSGNNNPDSDDDDYYLQELNRQIRSQSIDPRLCDISSNNNNNENCNNNNNGKNATSSKAQSSSSSTVTTSATLVSESQLINQKCEQREQLSKPPPPQLASGFGHSLHSPQASPSPTTPPLSNSTEMNQFKVAANERQRLLLSPAPLATSDYWSSSAVTTNTNTSGSGGGDARVDLRGLQQQHQRRRPYAPAPAQNRLSQQQQQLVILSHDQGKQILPTATAGGDLILQFNELDNEKDDCGGLLVPSGAPTAAMQAAGDQDYYLDVAAAAQFNQHQQHLQLMHPFSQQDLANYHSLLMNQNQLNHDPNYQLQHRQQSLLSEQELLKQNVQLQQQQQQQQLVFQSLSDQDDYDDYAVPSDESCCRLDRSQVELVQLIGEGQKGYVFLGKLQSRSGDTIIDVAIKTLKYETEELIERLMSEAAMMKQLEHPHIIKFIGMCPETPALIAMELAKLGEVKEYLKLNKSSIRLSQLVLFTFQISTALSYLESKNYVHRDVAARNVLVCSHNCVKLADFGLSRNLQPQLLAVPLNSSSASSSPNSSYPLNQQQQQQLQQQQQYVASPRIKLPVRWLAPESLVFRRFTSASDVWMFAVCSWELFQFGMTRPWPQLRNNQVLLAIESGQRLARPDACPQRLYQLMLKCWSYAPVQRPKFREIKQSIWSIYLNERTREQLELERFEREKQRYIISEQHKQHQHQQQQQQQMAALNELRLASLSPQQFLGQPQQQQLQQQQQQRNVPLASPNGGQHANNNYATSNYSTNTTSTTTTTDKEEEDENRSTSPGSSAFGSLARGGVKQQRQQKRQTIAGAGGRQWQEGVLESQLARFEQRQPMAAPHGQRQPHVLQKQRSQGTIGFTKDQFEGDFVHLTPQHDQLASRLLELDKRNGPRQQQQHRAGKQQQAGQVLDNRRRHKRRPLDDVALDYNGRRTTQSARLYAMALNNCQDLDYSDEDDQDPGREEAENLRRRQRQQQQQQQRDKVGRKNVADQAQRRRFIESVSPALTVDSVGRMGSMEPNYEGVFGRGNQLVPVAPAKMSQVAMLRTNFERAPVAHNQSSVSPSSFRQMTTSPALTGRDNSPSSTRPASWRSDNAPSPRVGSGVSQQQQQLMLAKANQKQQQPVRAPSDQLGQMLQALKITPMKAKLKSPPEQNVRVLQREDKSSPPGFRGNSDQLMRSPTTTQPNDRAKLALIGRQDAAAALDREPRAEGQEEFDKEAFDKSNRMQLHERLLGRIRPSSSSPSSSSQKPSRPITAGPNQDRDEWAAAPQPDRGRQQQAPTERHSKHLLQQQLAKRHDKSVETVDQSLQLLESLMMPNEQTGRPGKTRPRSSPPPGSSLPRRTQRQR